MKPRNPLARFVPNRDLHVYLLLGALSVLIRLPILGPFDMVSYDGTYYLNEAKALWSTGPMPGAFPIGYPFFVSLLLPFADAVRAGQIVSFVASLGALFVIFNLARHYLRRDLAFYCALALAANPLFIRLSLQTFSEMAFVFWVLLACLWFAKEKDAFAGLSAGVAAITRPEVLAILGMFCLFRIKKPRALLVLVATATLMYSTNVLTFYVKTGEFNLLSKSEFFGAGLEDWRNRERRIESTMKQAGQEVKGPPTPGEIVSLYGRRLPREIYVLSKNLSFALLLLAGYGITRRRLFLWIAFIPLFSIPMFTVRSIDRYLLPYVPFAILYSFLAANEIKHPRYRRWAWGLIAAAVVAGPAINIDQLTDPTDEGFTELKRAGLYLKNHARPGEKLADRKPYVAFYSETDYVEIPQTSYEDAIQYLVDNDVRYLSLHLKTIKYLRPPLMSLLTHAPMVAGEFRYEQFHVLEEGYVLYKRARDENPLEWRRLTKPDQGFDSMPTWSPDGRFIAFSSTRLGNVNIYVVPTDGSQEPILTVGGPAHEDQPAWSPDGARIAFSSNRGGNWDIYTANVRSKNVRQITTDPKQDASPAWSPDGAHIAFTSERTGQMEIFVVEIATGEMQQITNDGRNNSPAFSHNGAYLSWIRTDTGLVILELASERRLVAEEPRDVNYRPSWSPDGSFIAVSARDWGSVDVYLLSSDGRRALLLTKNEKADGKNCFDALPAWSPDGTQLAIVSSVDDVNSIYILSNLEPYLERLRQPFRMVTFTDEPAKK